MTSHRAPNASDIATLLAERIEPLCRELLPNGTVDGDWYRATGWQGDPLTTIHVNLKTGKWHTTERRWVSPEPDTPQ